MSTAKTVEKAPHISSGTIFNPAQMDKGQEKQIAQLDGLICKYLRSHWSDYQDVSKSLSYQLVDGQVHLKTKDGHYRPMVLSPKNLTEKDWSILTKISKTTKALLLANIRKDAFYDSSSAFLPGSSGVIRLPKDIMTNTINLFRARREGDEVGVQEARVRYFNQGVALVASCALAFSLTISILEVFSRYIVSAVAKTNIAHVAGVLGLLASSIELVRLLSWICFTNKTRQELHVSVLAQLDTCIQMLGSKVLSEQEIVQLTSMFESVRQAVKHEDPDLKESAILVERAIESQNSQEIKTALEGYKRRLIYLDFEYLTKDLNDHKAHKNLSRKLGAKFVIDLQMTKDQLTCEMRNGKEVGFQQAEKLLKDANWQAMKKMILYGIGILCCVLAITGFVGGFLGMPLYASIGLFIAGLVISTLLSTCGQKYFVDSLGFGPLANYCEEERKRAFKERILACHTHQLV
ncbi:MAG: hypothetical protein K940chlam8_00123 [Chlamydiae bacterium]|nr:hypothetical protein [Chlamydiota bacterium]